MKSNNDKDRAAGAIMGALIGDALDALGVGPHWYYDLEQLKEDYAERFEDDFELPVLSAINGGGNNMARASLTGALAGAQVGLSGIPQRFIAGLADSDRLLEMATAVAEAGAL